MDESIEWGSSDAKPPPQPPRSDGAARDAAQPEKERAGAIWDEARHSARAKLNEQKDAAAAGIRNYVTSIDVRNAHATVATEVVIKDGATVIWRQLLPAAMATPVEITFPTPLRGTAATAMNVACITTGAQVYVNAQGFAAP